MVRSVEPYLAVQVTILGVTSARAKKMAKPEKMLTDLCCNIPHSPDTQNQRIPFTSNLQVSRGIQVFPKGILDLS